MKIGFISNQLDNRGTGDALYNYAHYNEKILGNESHIITRVEGNHNPMAKARFKERFSVSYLEYEDVKDLDAYYHIKSGYDDGLRTSIPYLVHSVFDNEPHGTVYATVSPWMGARFGLPYVPHIVQVHPTNENLREWLGIPKDAVVFGRHGGTDSFDIPFVKNSISYYVQTDKRVYFLFMNTDEFVKHPRVIHLPSSVDPKWKKMFINTCDAMIHARSRGETFGIAVGEFAISGKPIITYSESHERAHLEELGHFALTYKDTASLEKQFDKVVAGPLITWGYGQYTPERVMSQFDEVFLSCVK